MGQTKPEIFVVNFVVSRSIDERVVEVLEDKLRLIEGSIFEPSEIIDNRVSDDSLPVLLDKDTLEKEVERSKGLISAFEWTTRFPGYDYDILDVIDTSYCSARKIQIMAESESGSKGMFLDQQKFETWRSSIMSLADRFKEVLEYYS